MKRILLVLIIFLLPLYSFGYEKKIHRKITKQAIGLSNIEQYLNDNLNLSLNNTFDNKFAWLWIQDGSVWEDDDISMRWLNHFYDPTTGEGLSYGGVSSLLWGKDFPSNVWDWKTARDSYYNALTDSNPDYRETYFSYVFRSLGQIIHLIQDKAVPAHVRNDPHIYFSKYQADMYEKYTGRESLNYTGYAPVDNSVFNSFDTFWINSGKGLAEFTNSNFLSRNTNIDDNKYPLPVPTGEWLATETIKDHLMGELEVEVKYIEGYVTDHYRSELSSPINHLSAFSYFDFEMQKFNGERVYSLSDKVHQDYASFLIPRAVGYSAGLLNYFFRGEMDMVEDTETGSGYVIVNNTDEDMNGTFELWYDNKNDERIKIQSWDLSIAKESSGNNKSSNVTFDPPTDAKEPGKYMLVFRGELGNEEGAVVGKKIEILEGYVVYILGSQMFVNYIDGSINIDISDILTDELTGENMSPVRVRFAVRNPELIVVVVESNERYIAHVYSVDYSNNEIIYQGVKKELDKQEEIVLGLPEQYYRPWDLPKYYGSNGILDAEFKIKELKTIRTNHVNDVTFDGSEVKLLGSWNMKIIFLLGLNYYDYYYHYYGSGAESNIMYVGETYFESEEIIGYQYRAYDGVWGHCDQSTDVLSRGVPIQGILSLPGGGFWGDNYFGVGYNDILSVWSTAFSVLSDFDISYPPIVRWCGNGFPIFAITEGPIVFLGILGPDFAPPSEYFTAVKVPVIALSNSDFVYHDYKLDYLDITEEGAIYRYSKGNYYTESGLHLNEEEPKYSMLQEEGYSFITQHTVYHSSVDGPICTNYVRVLITPQKSAFFVVKNPYEVRQPFIDCNYEISSNLMGTISGITYPYNLMDVTFRKGVK